MSDFLLSSVFLVRNEHLNHQGHLFGGHLMAEIDTVGYCLLRRHFPQARFVTRAAEIAFHAPARLGDLVEFTARLVHRGTTSLRVEVSGRVGTVEVALATMVYVCIDAAGVKCVVPPVSQEG